MLDFVTIVSALGCGLIGGAFFAFSTFVMKALARLPAPQGIAAMQSINVTVINPWFLTPFLGMAATCSLLALMSLLRWQDARSPYWLAGGVLYVAGTFLVTMRANVPRNNALATVAPESRVGAELWGTYLTTWTAWNHVRTVAALGAAALLMVAYRG